MKIIGSIVFALLLFAGPVQAAEIKIGYLDIRQAIATSDAGKAASSQLQAKFLKVQEQAAAKQKELAADEKRNQDIETFVAESFAVMRAAYPFADNPYLQETVENLQPAMSRAYYLALDQRQANMADYLELFARLLEAVVGHQGADHRPLEPAAGLPVVRLLEDELPLAAAAGADVAERQVRTDDLDRLRVRGRRIEHEARHLVLGLEVREEGDGENRGEHVHLSPHSLIFR